MKNPGEGLTGSLLNIIPKPYKTVKKAGQRLIENNQAINIAGAVLISIAVIAILHNRMNRKKFQLSDFTEG